MSGLEFMEPITKAQARQKNPLVLAYIGDTVYDLFMRRQAVVSSESHVYELNKSVCAKVNAAAQSKAVLQLELTEEENDIFRRGRNAKCGSVPKNMSVTDYHNATGLEAVIGYLSLTGEYDRLMELFERIMNYE